MNRLTGDLIAWGVALALFLVIWLFIRWTLFRHDRRRNQFLHQRKQLLQEAAAELDADAVDAAVPHLKSRPPDPPYGVALARADGDDYFPIFEAPVSGAEFLEAWPTGSPYPPLRASMGGDGVPIGDPDFDAAYIVRAEDPPFARSWLDADARALIDEGRRLGRGGRLRLNVDRVRLRLRKEESLTSPRDLVALARIGLRLLERLREAVEGRKAVQFYDAPLPASAKPSCPVCGAAVGEGRVLCRRCRTPHHGECWEYAKGCSMFACGETRFSL